MSQRIKWVTNSMRGMANTNTRDFSGLEMQKVLNFHRSFPQYSATPLRSLNNLAHFIGLGGIFLKDESFRFGLQAFKVLGGSFAIAKYLAKKLNKDISKLDYEHIISAEVREQLGEITFATTTDGNHGRGVAWTANQLKQKAVVYMPKGSSEVRLNNILAEGACAEIVDMNYDDAVRMTDEQAKKHGWVIVQDTAWDGYREIPTWIMQGYGTLLTEALEQMLDYNVVQPTHVFVQAGVGSLAGAVQGVLTAKYGAKRPKTVVVEAEAADCLYRSAVAADGKPRAVGGDLATIMAGLACGEANTIGWELLRDYADAFVSCPDWVAACGMRILGVPLKGDPVIISGESGAVTAGLLVELMNNPALANLKEQLEIDEHSQVLLISTERNTDPIKYREIVWNGEYPRPQQ